MRFVVKPASINDICYTGEYQGVIQYKDDNLPV